MVTSSPTLCTIPFAYTMKSSTQTGLSQAARSRSGIRSRDARAVRRTVCGSTSLGGAAGVSAGTAETGDGSAAAAGAAEGAGRTVRFAAFFLGAAFAAGFAAFSCGFACFAFATCLWEDAFWLFCFDSAALAPISAAAKNSPTTSLYMSVSFG